MYDCHQKCNSDAAVNVSNKEGPKLARGVMTSYFLLLLLWGGRKNETRLLRWQDVDWDSGVVVFDETTTKNKKMAAMPLTLWARELLDERMRCNKRLRKDEDTWVFPSRQHGKPISSPYKLVDDLTQEAGIRLSPHDLRRTMATMMDGLEISLEDLGRQALIGQALHHRAGAHGVASATTHRYIMAQVENRRKMMQDHENNIRALIGLPPLGVAIAPVEDSIEAVVEQVKANPALRQKLLQGLGIVSEAPPTPPDDVVDLLFEQMATDPTLQ